ncbi:MULTISPECIES: 2,3-diaminopropionate biosynthesis protein SbnA [unclassified Moorena]|uniref:2,3-diaminopropionate biosynthesis protein SbnA n=1 Tax=unclassified Moorena TaxID=2683338 RepID=UPI0025E36008|nr:MULTISPECIES: 2,3-diaminopropionate biosynthesis protein SbnA [unclassified Moorena]
MKKPKKTMVGIISAIGNTPIIQLSNLFDTTSINFFAKLETINPGGSIKDRTALKMLENAIKNGNIKKNTTVIESTSGNLGIGLAQVCAYYKLKLICIVDPKASTQNIDIIKAYGGEIDYVSEPDPKTGEFLQARLKRVKMLCHKNPDFFWINQYSNIDNPLAHYETMREILEQLNEQVDYLFCAVSTCGTIRGCAEYIRKKNLNTQIIAVDVKGSQIFDNEQTIRRFPGMGAGVRTIHCNDELINGYILVSDQDCIRCCHQLVAREGILAGASSGGVVAAVEAMQNQMKSDSICVMILPDRGDRYLKTLYSETWIKENFGEEYYKKLLSQNFRGTPAPKIKLFSVKG